MKRASTPTVRVHQLSKKARVEESRDVVVSHIPHGHEHASIVAYTYTTMNVNWDSDSKVSSVRWSGAGQWTIEPNPAFTTACDVIWNVEGGDTVAEVIAQKPLGDDEFVCVRVLKVNDPGAGWIQGRAAHSCAGGLNAMPSLGHGCIIILDSETGLPSYAVYVVYDDDNCQPLEVAVLEGDAAVVYLNDSQSDVHMLHIDSLSNPGKVTPIVFTDMNKEEDWPEPDGTTVPGPDGRFHSVSGNGVWRVGKMGDNGTTSLLAKAELGEPAISVSACPLGVFVLLQSGLRFYPGAHREDLHHYTTIGYQPFEGACGMYVVPNPDVKGSYRAFIDGECAFIDVVDFTVEPSETLCASAPPSPSFPQDLQSRLQDIYASDSFPYLLGDGL